MREFLARRNSLEEIQKQVVQVGGKQLPEEKSHLNEDMKSTRNTKNLNKQNFYFLYYFKNSQMLKKMVRVLYIGVKNYTYIQRMPIKEKNCY